MQYQTTTITHCTDVLRQETALLEQLACAQETVRRAAFSRDWTKLDDQLVRLSEYGKEFELLEAERARIFGLLSGEGQGPAGFYALASRLEPPARKELTELYRKLKLETLKVRLANDALSSYLGEARTTVSGFLEAAFPDRKGKIYSRHGAPVHSEMRSIVLDRSL